MNRIIRSITIASSAALLAALGACSRSGEVDQSRRLKQLEAAGYTVDAAFLLQEDSDRLRREHLLYWTQLIDEYETKAGNYPFSSEAMGETINLIRIATPAQAALFTRGDRLYDKAVDQNSNDQWNTISTDEFIKEMERGLGRKIVPKFDPYERPIAGPNFYNYFATSDGYLMWVVCVSCGATQISTLLMMEPYPGTLNIASPKMVPKVTKAMRREDMIAHERFKFYERLPYHNESRIRRLEKDRIVEAGYGDRLPPRELK